MHRGFRKNTAREAAPTAIAVSFNGYSEKILTGVVRVSQEALQNIRATMGIASSVLRPDFDLPMEKAA